MNTHKQGWRAFRNIFFQEDLPPQDIQDVLQAANLLEIPEFEVFKLSHAYWYGSMPTDVEVEPVYLAYMFEGQVPLFVRQFSRRVHAMQCSGSIDRVELGVREPESLLRNIRFGVLVFVLLFAIQVLIYTMAAYTAGELPALAGRCFLPPCY